MPDMPDKMTSIPSENDTPSGFAGLSSSEAEKKLEEYGKNVLVPSKKENFFIKLFHIISEPMFLLLLIAAVIYFILGEPRDGAIMLIFVVCIISIDVIQEWKTDKTLKALNDLSAPRITVIRDGKETTILSSDIVPGDLMLICEGVKIPADGVIVSCSDLCINESSLTGESEGVWKVSHNNAEACQGSSDYWRRDYCYAGTLVTQGNALVLVEKTGTSTEYGKIGLNIASASTEKTPLTRQTGTLVKTCAIIALVLFLLVSVLTYINSGNTETLTLSERIVESILSGITLAMAMIPEEFPVILTVFLSMGAWRLAKKNALVRNLPSVETLGSVSVLCVDKTGTITMNKMKVQEIWASDGDEMTLAETMGLGCETNPYDPMEKAMLDYCDSIGIPREHIFGGDMITEYAFTNELKMMGHVWHHDGKHIIAAKGSPEHIFTICNLSDEEFAKASSKTSELSSRGLRVIAVAYGEVDCDEDVPPALTDCRLKLCGLVGLADPPSETVKDDISVCKQAGIRVVMITGDNGLTASAIAKQVGIENCDKIITGDMINSMSDEQLRDAVKSVNIFSRVVPEHKMRIVKAFQQNGNIVAMTGDGVNDAPALKHADIGIAMGKRGSEVSREAADLILMDDNFTTIVDTIYDGRRIYDNIRKAVGYVFAIHIPIALASLLAPLLGIASSMLMLLPLHVVLLEILIDPTCSIVLERQPAERNIMERPPRDPNGKLLNSETLIKGIIQGLVIAAASFGSYYYILSSTNNADVARSFGLTIIMLANLFLVQVNSSSQDFAIISLARLAKDKIMWAINIFTIIAIAVILYTPLSELLRLAPLSALQLLLAVLIAILSVFWYEIVKLIKRMKAAHK